MYSKEDSTAYSLNVVESTWIPFHVLLVLSLFVMLTVVASCGNGDSTYELYNILKILRNEDGLHLTTPIVKIFTIEDGNFI